MKKKYVDPEGHCIICRFKGVDIHHIKSRGSGGKDEEYNRVNLCHPHHQELHTIGNARFSFRYYEYREYLVKHNWEYCDFSKKWFRAIND